MVLSYVNLRINRDIAHVDIAVGMKRIAQHGDTQVHLYHFHDRKRCVGVNKFSRHNAKAVAELMKFFELRPILIYIGRTYKGFPAEHFRRCLFKLRKPVFLAHYN